MDKNKYQDFFCTAAIIILMVAASAKIKADIIPHIYSENTINICDSMSKKRVLFFVVIDKINRSDSLYGYNLKIKYDTAKLRIINYVEGNTLSEFFDKSFSFGLNGMISGYGISHWVIGPPSYGDSLLIGFLAEWLGSCPDSTYLSIEELEFTSEFKRKYDSLGGGYVTAVKIPQNKYIECNFNSSNYEINKDDSIVNVLLTIKIPDYHNTSSLNITFNMLDTLKLMECNIENNRAKIQSIDSNDNTLIISELPRGQNDIIISLKLRIIDKDAMKNAILKIANIEEDECSCILNFGGDSIRFHQDTLGVDEITSNLLINSEFIEIISSGEINSYEVYDYIGNLITKINMIDKPITKIYLKDYKKGIYFLLEKNNKNEIKKIYKFYSN